MAKSICLAFAINLIHEVEQDWSHESTKFWQPWRFVQAQVSNSSWSSPHSWESFVSETIVWSFKPPPHSVVCIPFWISNLKLQEVNPSGLWFLTVPLKYSLIQLIHCWPNPRNSSQVPCLWQPEEEGGHVLWSRPEFGSSGYTWQSFASW